MTKNERVNNEKNEKKENEEKLFVQTPLSLRHTVDYTELVLKSIYYPRWLLILADGIKKDMGMSRSMVFRYLIRKGLIALMTDKPDHPIVQAMQEYDFGKFLPSL